MNVDPARQYFPQAPSRSMSSIPPPRKDMSPTTAVLAGTTGAVLVVNFLHNMGAPEGVLISSWDSLKSTALAFGGPVALGIIAAQKLSPQKNLIMESLVASALAMTGMMVTGMMPFQIDMPTITTIAASAAGIYGGVMVADKLL